MPVRVLDLTEDPGPPDERVDGSKRGGAKKRAMAWIDAVAEDLPNVGDDVVDVVIDDEMMATPDGSPETFSRGNAAGPRARTHHSSCKDLPPQAAA